MAKKSSMKKVFSLQLQIFLEMFCISLNIHRISLEMLEEKHKIYIQYDGKVYILQKKKNK
jgi:hypothetical protein